MKQAIAGVAPPEDGEVTIMLNWPSIAVYALGRCLGRGYALKHGTYIFTLGNFLALKSIPIALALYFLRIAPFFGIRYALTNRRVIVQRGWTAAEEKSIELDRFDSIELVRQPGQEWFDAGDLVFRQGNTETFRLPGVSRPEAFRQTCLKARAGYVGVKTALARQLAHA